MTKTMRIAIAGAGNVGHFAAGDLSDRGHDVVLIEQNQNSSTTFADGACRTSTGSSATRASSTRLMPRFSHHARSWSPRRVTTRTIS